MPFRKKCRVTLENINNKDPMTLYYQVDYTLTEVPDDAAYFHVQYRRQNPDVSSVYTIVDGIKGKGQFVGVYLAWGVNNNGWWGEGEIKFYIDGDSEFPTICGTGTEDYFCGSYDFDTKIKNASGMEETVYTEFCTPYSGLAQVIRGRRTLQCDAAVWPLSLAYNGPGSFRKRSKNHDSGSGLET